jgi:acyl-coenzyme A synthetase/AMP-(fatty) acid ligase
MVALMVDHPRAAEQDLSCLRLATSAGEALPAELHRRWDEAFGVDLLDGLGTAEMWHIFLSNRPGDVRPGTLGKAVPGFDVEVRDDDGRPVPDGEVGWLWVRGGSRAIGYWHRMRRTMEAFRGEWYVSGDMVSRDADGVFTYAGRADDMLKVSGKWLAPGEVESCLLEHPAVAEVAVVGVAGASGLTVPRACIVRRNGEQPTDLLADELRSWVRDRLEAYKYPREIVFLDALPRTHLGKVDRAALRR